MRIKGVIHVHSTYSYDGSMELAALKDIFARRGIHFALMTEHTDRLSPAEAEKFIAECDALTDERFAMIPGFEVPYGNAHVLVAGARRFVSSITEDALSDSGGLAILAHPHRSGFAVDAKLRGMLDGIEVWNLQYDGKYAPRLRSLRFFKKLRERRNMLRAYAALDFHRASHAGGPVLVLDVPAIGKDAIMERLRNGAFTCQRGNVSLRSDGVMASGGGMRTILVGMLSIFIIWISKRAGKALARMGVKPPQRIKEFLRSKL